MKSNLSYYYGSIAMTLLAIAGGYMVAGVTGAFIVSILAILEISLSFDNAVVNAKILANWDAFWRRIFLTVGILIAVFGMRLVFPILIVSLTTGMGFIEVFDVAINKPDDYAHALHLAHPSISGFGGAFLMMVALGFFFEEKHTYWIEWVETKLSKFGQIEALAAAITIGFAGIVSSFMAEPANMQFFGAAVWGVVTFIITHGLGTLLGGADESDGAGPKIVKAGIGGFLYLEVLDASFSFDGVIGAFALSHNIFIIMLGLMAGAFFVRSMTIHLVDKGTLAQYKYLEHGAFYAIAALAAIMFLHPIVAIPELITGLIGATLIIVAFLHSVHENKKTQISN